jgi:hypothetical protein
LALLWLLPLAVGVAVGGWLGWLALPQVAPKAPNSTVASLPVAAGQGGSGAPRACLRAVEQADAVISYLVGGIRDRRLDASLLRYVEAARSCRKETSP